ncbi:MAG: YncE family protein [Acidobacteria bacterium]|nr:YncE family protein [Acidobacteriota bacterium]
MKLLPLVVSLWLVPCCGQPRLLVVDKGENMLAILDVQSGKILSRLPTGDGPHEVATSADGSAAFVTNYGAREPGHSISVIGIAKNTAREVDLGPLRRPHGITESHGQIYFTAESNKLIGRYDPASDRVDWLMGTGQNSTHMILISKDGSRMFTANIGSDSVTIIERTPQQSPAGWNETAVAVGKGPEGMDLAPDGRELWAANSRDGSVSIIDVAQKKVIQSLDLHTRRSNRLKFTPDGKRVLITDLDAGELVVIDAAARKELKRIPVGHQAEGILVAPDGAAAYVAVAGDDNIAVIDLSTLAVIRRLQPGKGPDGMAWAR